MPRSGPDSGKVAVMLLASASAREVRFARQPEIRVRLCGGLDSVHVVERRNLPEPVVVGQTYRDVYVAVEILGRVDAACLTRRLGLAGDSLAMGGAREPACASISIGGAASPPRAAPSDGAAPRTGTDGAPPASAPSPAPPRP